MPAANNPRIAVYTGVFDPIHHGHLDIIQRASRIFDKLVVGVGINPEKQTFFTEEERVQLLKRVVADYPNVDVQPITGLAVLFVRQVGAYIMIRGLRTLSDMEYEFTMSLTNQSLDTAIETVFLLAKDGFSYISGTLIRQIAEFHGNLDPFVPPLVKEALQARIREMEARL
jgi:pantetheine-phosphate adenylyltransferase